MQKYLLSFLLIVISFSSFAQQDDGTVYFSEMISLNVVKYKKNINEAYRENDVERANFLFDSLVKHVLSGTQFDNFKVSTLDAPENKKVYLTRYEKPLFLMTYATWCEPDEGELPALNELADQYHDQIDFVILFWDKRKDVKKVASLYSSNIKLVYIDETDNNSSHVVNKLKHVFGLPTTILIDIYGSITDIQREVANHFTDSYNNSYEMHYNYLSKGISQLISELDANVPSADSSATDLFGGKIK